MKKNFANLEEEKEAAYHAALRYLSAIKTEKQVRDKLAEKGFSKDAVFAAVKKCKEYRFIDDLAYAKAYVANYQFSKGKNKLKFELQTKGIHSEWISQVLETVADETGVIETLAGKYMKNKEKDAKNRNKCVHYLLAKGFSMDDIFPVVRKIFKVDYEEDA